MILQLACSKMPNIQYLRAYSAEFPSFNLISLYFRVEVREFMHLDEFSLPFLHSYPGCFSNKEDIYIYDVLSKAIREMCRGSLLEFVHQFQAEQKPSCFSYGYSQPHGPPRLRGRICCSSPSVRNSKVDIEYVVSTSYFTNDLGSDLY